MKKPAHSMKGQNGAPPDPSGLSPLSEVTAEAEKEHIMKILKVTSGNRTRAAEVLGISRKTLWEKLKAYGIEY